MSPKPGTGGLGGANGVKAAKLYVKQDQIEKHLSAARAKFPGKIARKF